MVRKQLVVFDFDWSFVDQDTDRWVCEVLSTSLRRQMEDLEAEMQWTDLVAWSLEQLHALRITRQQIEDALRILPFHPAMLRAVENLKAATPTETHFVILSNSNSVYISTILEHRNLTHLFDEITTNPAEWDTSGLLKLRRRVDPSGPQHTCKVGCSPNMCKGEELDAYLARYPDEFERVIYVGDGSNDYCPVLRLKSHDIVLVRRHRGLEKRVAGEGGLKCNIEYWDGAWEVEEIFAKL